MIPTICQATQIVYPVTYGPTSQVTNVTLNGNNSAISNVVNGNLDNTNANTTSGYRFYQTVSVLPSSGSQGAVYFLTSDNTLNFDTGSAFNKSVSVNSPVNGDMLYYNSGWSKLAIGSNNAVIMSNGSIPTYSSNPTVPIGGIIMWSGTIASIPSNWQLCDGTNGTPNLTNRFVVGANADSGGVAKSTITGSALQTSEGQLPSTTVTITQFNTGNSGAAFGTGIPTDGASSSALSGTFGTGTANVARFFALAYIERMT